VTRILIPVYNAAAELSRCLAALAASVPANTPMTLIDDASTDPAVAVILTEFAASRSAVDLLSNPVNLGFVGNVNRGFRETSGNVLLLNSDTLPTSGFLSRIEACARSDERIATVTPFSNNAEICSFPLFCVASPMPPDMDAVSTAFAAEQGEAIDVPTGVGFCMWLRRATLDQIGDFDAATFGRGYGEENDFCRRAAAHGWRNVVCPSAYVGHVGHASFAPTGERPGGENLRRLSARYPRYNAEIADFISRDPLAGVRARVAERVSRNLSQANASPRP